MNYTKGPWFAIEYAGYWEIQKEDFYSGEDDLLNQEKCPDAESNAHLAAASPDMLEALIKVRSLIKQCGNAEDLDCEEFDYIQAAIDKAINPIRNNIGKERL